MTRYKYEFPRPSHKGISLWTVLLIGAVAAFFWIMASGDPVKTVPIPVNAAPIEMYSLTTCGVCKYMRGELKEAGIPFREYMIDKDPSRKAELDRRMRAKRIPGGSIGTPVIFANSQIFFGRTPVNDIKAAITATR